MSRLALAVLFPGLFVCVLSAHEAVSPKCDGYTLYKDAGGYLIYNEMPVTFDDAKKRCAAEDAVLASPTNDGIKATMMDILWKTRNVKNFFTGFSAEPHNGGIFSSIEGTQLSKIKHTWAPGEPNNGDGQENCIVLSPHGTMSDENCNNRNPYFCFLSERKAQTLKIVCSGGYAGLDNTTRSCYKLHSNVLVFDEAVKVCEEEGGYLAIMNGDDEADAAANLLVKCSFAFVRFQLNKNSVKWMALQGKTIEDADGDAKWAKGQNSSSATSTAPKKSFGLLGIEGILYHTLPSQKFQFICEKDPEILSCL